MRMRKVTTILATAAGLVLAGTALADKYGDLTKDARPVGGGDVAGLFWSATVDCGKLAGDLAKRQCEGVRIARGGAAAGGTYVAAGDGLSFHVGEWDAQKGGLPLTVYGCIACEKTVDIGGAGRYLVTKGDVKVEGGAVRGPVIHRAVRKFKSEADAKKWKETVVPRLRTQFVFKVPARPTEWTAEGARGYAVDMVGFRVWDPCDGAMICSNPPSENEKADAAACKGGQPSGTDIQGDARPEEKKPEEKKPDEPKIPERLTSADIDRTMSKVRTQVNACFTEFGVPGKADLTIQIGGDGSVLKVELRGEFKDTPTGECIVKAAKEAKFPAFKNAPMNIKYPFILR
jgi:hypothetical protein